MPDTTQENVQQHSNGTDNSSGTDTPSPKVSTPVIKFLIGFTAGLCAAFFPRLTASLAVSSGDSNIVLFDSSYITLSLVFAVLVGLIVMILEWRVPREPRATFMMAIGVPALITGSLNTTTGIDTVSSQAKDNQALAKQLQDLANIQTLPATGGITPLSLNTNETGSGQQAVAWLKWAGIRDAQAGTVIARKTGATAAGITVQEPLYYIVVAQASSKDEARQKAQAMKAQLPSAVAVQSGSHYLVLYSSQPFKRTEAVLLTVKLKQGLHMSPQLLPAK